MKAIDAVKTAAERAGVPITHIGPAMGKGRTYANRISARGSTPQADNLAAMLQALGWTLAAMPAEDMPPSAIPIDPPARTPDATPDA